MQNMVQKHSSFKANMMRKLFNARAKSWNPEDDATCQEFHVNAHLDGIEVVAQGANRDCVILYFHGGAFHVGSVWTHRELLGRLSQASGAAVVSVNYRLAPENPFPAGLDDAYEALCWVRQRNTMAKVAVAGDSAGGNLAYALMARLAQRKEVQPVACVTLCPWLLLDPCVKRQKDVTFLEKLKLSRSYVMAEQYFRQHPASDPEVSPCLASEDLVRQFPPSLIHADAGEPLSEDAQLMAALIQRAGAVVEMKEYETSEHVFQAYPHIYPKEADDSIEGCASFLRQHFNLQGPMPLTSLPREQGDAYRSRSPSLFARCCCGLCGRD